MSGSRLRRSGNQLIPARGRKPPETFLTGLGQAGINSSPQGDGNHSNICICLCPGNQLIPARGRKHRPQGCCVHRPQESTHPRKGTETTTAIYGDFADSRINSSPQGDGNAQARSYAAQEMESTHPRKGTETPVTDAWVISANVNQLIPARGRKPDYHIHLSCFRESTHPRKGTETVLTQTGIHSSRINSSPQGDGNFMFCNFLKFINRNQLIPARGRKRVFVGRELGVYQNQLIPARGRKPLLRLEKIAVGRINSSPQGDGNFTLLAP